MPSDLELLGRLLIAAVLGGAIGAERELNDQAAGLRTHMLLTIGACLFTVISAYGFRRGVGTDPSRLAAQIVTGIGFLGGGAIVRHGLTVKGLTTAASIWATASVGVAVGAGDYVLGVGGAALVVGTLVGLRRVSATLQRWGVSREEFMLATRPGFDVERIVEAVRRERVDLRGLDREAGKDEDRVVLVGQHRYTLGRDSWEIPEGGVGPGESALEGVQRELREETGLEADDWRELCRVDLSNSVTDEQAVLFVARELRHGEAAPDPTESIALRWVPFDEALAMTRAGRITDAMSVVAIQRLALDRARATER